MKMLGKERLNDAKYPVLQSYVKGAHVTAVRSWCFGMSWHMQAAVVWRTPAFVSQHAAAHRRLSVARVGTCGLLRATSLELLLLPRW